VLVNLIVHSTNPRTSKLQPEVVHNSAQKGVSFLLLEIGKTLKLPCIGRRESGGCKVLKEDSFHLIHCTLDGYKHVKNCYNCSLIYGKITRDNGVWMRSQDRGSRGRAREGERQGTVGLQGQI